MDNCKLCQLVSAGVLVGFVCVHVLGHHHEPHVEPVPVVLPQPPWSLVPSGVQSMHVDTATLTDSLIVEVNQTHDVSNRR